MTDVVRFVTGWNELLDILEIKEDKTMKDADERWNMAQDLVALLTDAGYDVIHADAINLLERTGWIKPKSPWTYIDQERPETLPPNDVEVLLSAVDEKGNLSRLIGTCKQIFNRGQFVRFYYVDDLGTVIDWATPYAWTDAPDPAPYEVKK